MKRLIRCAALGGTVALVAGCAFVGRVDVTDTGTQAEFGGHGGAVSDDGRFVVVNSGSALVASDTNLYQDVYVRDTATGKTSSVSVAAGGGEPNGPSRGTGISADGRYVVFISTATDLLSGPALSAGQNVFVRDRTAETTTLVTATTDGKAPNGPLEPISDVSLSANGRVVAFTSPSTNLVAGTSNPNDDNHVYVRDIDAGVTEHADVTSGEVIANSFSYASGLNSDGSIVVFTSYAPNLNASGAYALNVYARRRSNGTTSQLSLAHDGGAADGLSQTNHADNISANGRYVVFSSLASNLTTDDVPDTQDLFVRDLVANTTERVKATTGAPAPLAMAPYGISNDGRFVLALGYRTGLLDAHAYVVDRSADRLSLVGSAPNGAVPVEGSVPIAISSDGMYVVFDSKGSGIVSPDSNPYEDAFLRSTVVPVVLSATPAVAMAGTSLTVTLTGLYLFDGAYVNFGDGITVNSVDVVDEQHAAVHLTIAADAVAGPRPIVYRNPGSGAGPSTGGVMVLPNGFSVT
jgi:Bacterial Ig-like domain (DUF1927).